MPSSASIIPSSLASSLTSILSLASFFSLALSSSLTLTVLYVLVAISIEGFSLFKNFSAIL